MDRRYVEPRAFRYREESGDGAARLRVPVRRQWFLLAFIPFWLAGWTAGGIAAIHQVLERFDWFLIFWLGAWAVGWLFAAGLLASQLGGSEIVSVAGGDLSISAGVGRLRRTWRYRGGMIRHLSSSDPGAGWPWGDMQRNLPVFTRPRRGAVRFEYGADTVYLASGVDEAEGRAIVAWLAQRLPTTARGEGGTPA